MWPAAGRATATAIARRCGRRWCGSALATPPAAFTLITREGGAKQWAYKGKPLYLFSGDVNPNDTNGDGVNGVWHIARP